MKRNSNFFRGELIGILNSLVDIFNLSLESPQWKRIYDEDWNISLEEALEG